MKYSNSILAFLFSAFILSCQSQNSHVYSDLRDYGYQGKIKSISTSFFSTLIESSGKWEIQDTIKPRLTIVAYFNKDGNFTKRVLTSESSIYETVFQYAGKTKTGWTKMNNGQEISVAKIEYTGNSGFIETEFENLIGPKKFQEIYIFDKNQRTKKIEDIGYNTDGSINYHSITSFEDDTNGNLHKFTTKDILNNTTDNYEFEITTKDKNNNPLNILVKKNSKPFEVRKISIVYE